MKVQPSTFDVQPLTTSEGTRFKLPFQPNWLILTIGSLASVGVLIAATALVLSLFVAPQPFQPAPNKAFLTVFTIIWVTGMLHSMRLWLWNSVGRETVMITSTELIHVQSVGPWKRSREYDLREVSDLRALTTTPLPWGYQFHWLKTDRLAFDYGAKTHTFGAGLDEAQGKQLLAMIARARSAG